MKNHPCFITGQIMETAERILHRPITGDHNLAEANHDAHQICELCQQLQQALLTLQLTASVKEKQR